MRVCVYTGSAISPYVLLTVPGTSPLAASPAARDIVPAPAGGCPATVQSIRPRTPSAQAGDLICHATGDPAKPYLALLLGPGTLVSYQRQPQDLIPAPATGCPPPGRTLPAGPPHANGPMLAAPKPKPKPKPTLRPKPRGKPKVVLGATPKICRATGNPTSPYLALVLGPGALASYPRQPHDLIPAPPTGCPGPRMVSTTPQRPKVPTTGPSAAPRSRSSATGPATR